MFGIPINTLLAWANSVYLISVAVAAISSVAIYQLSSISSAEKDRELDRYKTEAKTQISSAQTDSALAHKSSEKAKADAAIADAKAEDARLKQQELKNDNVKLETNLEKEKLSRLELEKAISPRYIEQDEFAENMRAFKGTKVKILSIADSEAWYLAGQIAFALNYAGWEILYTKKTLDETYFHNGVNVLIGDMPQFGTPNSSNRKEAFQALINQFNANNIFVQSRIPMQKSEALSPDTIEIRIGWKSLEYLTDRKANTFKNKTHGNLSYFNKK